LRAYHRTPLCCTSVIVQKAHGLAQESQDGSGRFGKPGASRVEMTAGPGAEKVSEATRRDRRQSPWNVIGCRGNPVQEVGCREALRPPERLRGSVHTLARRRVTTASAIVSSVARLVSAFISRETEVDGWGAGESQCKRPPKMDHQRSYGNIGCREMQDPGAGGRRPGGSDWPKLNSGVACTPTYAVLSRGCYQREEAHTGAQETARLKVTTRDAFGLKLSPNLLPKRSRGNPDKADVYTASAAA